MLLLRADCIRVTHPYDTLGQILLSNLPFVLHVLGLPLAFILSQDQTLHSIFFSPESLVISPETYTSYSKPASLFRPFSESQTLGLCHLILGPH